MYNWDLAGKFNKVKLATIMEYVPIATFSYKNQEVFLFYQNGGQQYMTRYNAKYQTLVTHLVDHPSGPWKNSLFIDGAVYVDQTDQLWVWYKDQDDYNNNVSSVAKLTITNDDTWTLEYREFQTIVLPSSYTSSGDTVYFSGSGFIGNQNLLTMDLAKKQILLDYTLRVGFNFAYNDSKFYFAGWTKYNAFLLSVDSTTKQLQTLNSFQTWSYNTKCWPSVIDNYFVSTLLIDSSLPTYFVLNFAVPGAANYVQQLDSFVAWVWKGNL